MNISEFRARLPRQHLSDSRLHLPPDLSKPVTTLNTERSHRDGKIDTERPKHSTDFRSVRNFFPYSVGVGGGIPFLKCRP